MFFYFPDNIELSDFHCIWVLSDTIFLKTLFPRFCYNILQLISIVEILTSFFCSLDIFVSWYIVLDILTGFMDSLTLFLVFLTVLTCVRKCWHMLLRPFYHFRHSFNPITIISRLNRPTSSCCGVRPFFDNFIRVSKTAVLANILYLGP